MKGAVLRRWPRKGARPVSLSLAGRRVYVAGENESPSLAPLAGGDTLLVTPSASCPALCRVSTPWDTQRYEDVDGRVKPGHDGEGVTCTRAALTSGTSGSLPLVGRARVGV